MYPDRKAGISTSAGCKHQCGYCIDSFQKQMKRQRQRCEKCYTFEPHSHPERLKKLNPEKLKKLKKGLPRTYGDEFIWINSSGDIAFAEKEMMDQTLEMIQKWPDRTFFFQTKNPMCYFDYNFPDNCLLGITLETNRDEEYKLNKISKAPLPSFRKKIFVLYQHPRKIVVIEPILNFDLDIFVEWNREINPERIYIGYDSKGCGLPEPDLIKTILLINELSKFTKVKTKYMKGM